MDQDSFDCTVLYKYNILITTHKLRIKTRQAYTTHRNLKHMSHSKVFEGSPQLLYSFKDTLRSGF